MRKPSSQSRLGRCCRSCGRIGFLIACAPTVVALILSATLQASVATAFRSGELPGQTVNRVLKGDRLLASGPNPKNIEKLRDQVVPQPRGTNSKLPYGCESMVSPAADKQLARIPGRCVS
jgi:hypothetical protein